MLKTHTLQPVQSSKSNVVSSLYRARRHVVTSSQSTRVVTEHARRHSVHVCMARRHVVTSSRRHVVSCQYFLCRQKRLTRRDVVSCQYVGCGGRVSKFSGGDVTRFLMLAPKFCALKSKSSPFTGWMKRKVSPSGKRYVAATL